ncbi:ABC transporter ATP-binding protein [Clostridium polynesiense]|uniref:ABC transporter ATP-binding protein n=1 Tax=Clostridium polynesiense TaxID=1325933 RepID=UPI0005902ECF|nr:ATP-binding cassette domain-containing protein [Clostridium polynesiense]
MDKIIEVKGLKKSYGSVKAVQGIDFYVERGKLFAFLGPNGAGKSTTIDMLCTLLKPDEGEILVDECRIGVEDDEIRKVIGVVFQESILDPLLTVRENLLTRGGFYSLEKSKLKEAVKKAAEAAEVLDFLDRPYGNLSGGQRRRADIARALINTPKILFLDEPTTGLDPQTKESVWRTIRELQSKEGMTVFLTTHYMEEAEDADYIIVIDNGKIAAKGTPYELKQKYSSDLIKIKPILRKEVISLLDKRNISYCEKGEIIQGKLENSTEAIGFLKEAENIIESFEVIHGTMDDVFINITGREMREDA